MPSTTGEVTARLPDGRLLIARIDPTLPEQHSPLQRALRAANLPDTTDPTEPSP